MSAEDALRALSEPRRLQILRLVRDEALSVGEIAAHFDITQQAVSQHLRVLKAADLVTEERRGTRHLFVVRPDGLATVADFLSGLWPAGLARLKAIVESDMKSHGEGRGNG